MMSFSRLILILVSGVWVGMSFSAVAQEITEDSLSELAEHMHEHLDSVNDVKSAVIAGRLDDVRAPATWLANHEKPAGLPSVESVDEMRRYAAQAAVATDLVTAAAD